MEKELCFIKHSVVLTMFSPLASLYQTTSLFNKPFWTNTRLVPFIFPQQIFLRYGQLHLSTLSKENVSPIAAFGLIGILQGIVYGHSGLYFSKQLGLTHNVQISNYIRGPLFASSRDIISQGIPYFVSGQLEDDLYFYPKLLGISATSTVLSHPLHCLQTFNQNNPHISQLQVIKQFVPEYRFSLFYKGVLGRIMLLFITNISNDFFLRQVWC